MFFLNKQDLILTLYYRRHLCDSYSSMEEVGNSLSNIIDHQMQETSEVFLNDLLVKCPSKWCVRERHK